MIEALSQLGLQVLQPLIDPASRTFGPALLIAAVIALLVHRKRGLASNWREALGSSLWTRPSTVVDLQLLITRRLLGVIGLIPAAGGAWWLAVSIATGLDHHLGQPSVPVFPSWLITLGYSITLFVVWDLSRFAVHLLLHRVESLWQFHQVHHSAEVLTPLTFHRVHPVESMLYSLRGVLSTGVLAGVAYWLFRGTHVEYTLLGVHGLGLVCNLVWGNLRHSHVWIGFGPLERWFLSPAQHQLHHGEAPGLARCNYGTWLACWDRMGGCWAPSPEAPPERFGLDQANHDPQSLLSALIDPIHAAAAQLVPRRLTAVVRFAPLALLLIHGSAHGENADPPGEEPDWFEEDEGSDEDDGTMIVSAERGIPRVAGSAHVLTEEDLERHEYMDIHQVLSGVPGVYIRQEDGFGLRPNIGLRGGNSDRSAKITLLEDGIPLSPAPYAAPAAYYFPMPLRLVGVEVIKGAAAIRHGPQTIGGAVNLRTRRVPRESVAAIDAGYGLRNTRKVHGYAGAGSERWGVLAEAAHLSTDGFKVIDHGGTAGFVRQDAMLKARVGSDRAQTLFNDLELKLGYGREVSNETYLGLSAGDIKADPDRRYAASAGDLMQWDRTQAALTWRFLSGQDVDARTVLYIHQLDRSWAKLNGFSDGTDLHDLLLKDPSGGQPAAYLAVLRGEEDSSGVDQRLLRGTNDRLYQNMGLQTVAHWRTESDTVRNELEMGLRLHSDDVVRKHTERSFDMVSGFLQGTDGDPITTLDNRSTAQAIALHLHDEVALGRLHLFPGMRYEHIRTAAGADGTAEPQTMDIILPGFGAYLQSTSWLGLIAGAHRGFSPIPPGSAAQAVAETAWNYEAGFRMAAKLSEAEVIGFYSDYENLTGQCTLSNGCSEQQLGTQFNGGQATVRGVETTVGQGVALSRGFNLDLGASYAWTDARFDTGFLSEFPQYGQVQAGDGLPYVPQHQGAGSASLNHAVGQLAVTATGRSGMRDAAGSGEEMDIPSSLTVDVAGELRFGEHWALYTTATNIADQRSVQSWRPFGGRPNPPRQVMVGLKAAL